jgi:hypothetical protein
MEILIQFVFKDGVCCDLPKTRLGRSIRRSFPVSETI